MSKETDIIKDSVIEFDRMFGSPEPSPEDDFKKTISFYFAFYNHAYLKALADEYGVTLTSLGEQFFEPMVASIIGHLPDDRREAVVAKALRLQQIYLDEHNLEPWLLVDWSKK